MILLSFDIEEFDAPLEHGVELPFEEQMRTSVEGTRKILACLARHRDILALIVANRAVFGLFIVSGTAGFTECNHRLFSAIKH